MKKKLIVAMMAVMLCSSCQTKPSTKEVCNTNEVLETEEVLRKSIMSCYERSYDGPIELLEDSELVVLATADINRSIVNYENCAISNCTDFTIDQVLYGQTDEEVITVFEGGGIVPYEDFCKVFDYEIEKERLGQYVEYNMHNVAFIQDHEQYILFLQKNVVDRYITVGNFMGRYVLNAGGGFSRSEPEPNFYPPTSTYINQDPDASSNPQFTLEQMIEICNEYQNTQ